MTTMKEKRLIRSIGVEQLHVTRQINVIQAKMTELMALVQRLTKPVKRGENELIDKLAPRQRQVFELLRLRKKEAVIGELLGIDRKTVSNIKNRVAKKLGLQSARDLKYLLGVDGKSKK